MIFNYLASVNLGPVKQIYRLSSTVYPYLA
jgi:hypothetical protein